LIKKTAGNHHKIFNENNFLNLDIISDLPNIFSNFFIDLSDVKTQTTLKVNKEEIIKLFEALLEGNMNVMSDIKEVISFTINEQYKKGL
jgi:putative protease